MKEHCINLNNDWNLHSFKFRISIQSKAYSFFLQCSTNCAKKYQQTITTAQTLFELRVSFSTIFFMQENFFFALFSFFSKRKQKNFYIIIWWEIINILAFLMKLKSQEAWRRENWGERKRTTQARLTTTQVEVRVHFGVFTLSFHGL